MMKKQRSAARRIGSPDTGSARRYFKEVRFRQIRSLVELSRCGSFAGTAAALDLSVPSVWQQVRSLEEEYGVQLAVADGSKVRLTEDGQTLVDLAAPLVESFDGLREMFEDKRSAAVRTLTVVAPSPSLSGALRGPIMQYRQHHPKVKLVLVDRVSRLARQIIEEDGADLAVMGMATGDEPMPQFQCLPLTRHTFHLMCPQGHPLATARRITLANLVREPLVLAPQESSSHRQIRHVFAQAGLLDRMNVIMTATNRALLLNYVAIGFGIAIGTSAASVRPPKRGPGESEIVVREISSLFGHEEVFLVQRKGRFEPEHVRVFRQLVQQAFGEKQEEAVG
ncbi:transcriptional regulator /LysR family transcriptional regulator [Roseimicrobium gellanilyticum]|uniref:Transcriptional regulator /LysR family transcriptional regulator n=1 Tax=Roseimicrobium gellanilyticum TaxID=748857 RepID=A0A366HSN5_9BACT|nr:LysR family transcriptional regulator [Roseimicrobium gellanilyticum]RBP46269.1 transcriptional regulator /LysR family transcriptional regulator [Roseimicrobium gellanilyticum]